jgi:hypothetical protein
MVSCSLGLKRLFLVRAFNSSKMQGVAALCVAFACHVLPSVLVALWDLPATLGAEGEGAGVDTGRSCPRTFGNPRMRLGR